ncbi:hypothetical protein EBU99_07780 [bacterium]|nr:hypothetical protein [bacterium]
MFARVSTKLFSAAAIAAFVLNASCGRTAFVGSFKNDGQKTPVVGDGKKTANPQPTVIPPVPVAGSYLTGELNASSGQPLANAQLKIQINSFITNTDTNGVFKIPANKIPGPTFEMTVQHPGSDFDKTVELKMPEDLIDLLQASSTSSTNTELAKKLSLALPSAPTMVSDGNGKFIEKYSFNSTSLPLTTTQKFELFADAVNESAGKYARYQLKNIPANASEVKLAYSISEKTLLDWNGSNESQLSLLTLSDFSSCSDTSYSSAAGPMRALPVGKCGVNLELSPFSSTQPNYFRIAVVTPQSVKLSPVLSWTSSPGQWLQFHTQVQSCYPDYFGPAVGSNYGNTPPACTASMLGQAWCTSTTDGSPSKCQFCESNLFICQ